MKHANHCRALLACALLFASAVQAAGLVRPTDTDLQKELDQILQQHPDAVQISEHEIAWGEGQVILDLQVPASVKAQTRAIPSSCRAGYYCFYDSINFNGRQISLSSCTSSGYSKNFGDFGMRNKIKSWAVNRTVNRIDVKNASGGLLWRELSHSSAAVSRNGSQADRFTCYN